MAAAALDTDLASNVKKALKRGPAQPMFFAFFMKGGAGGKLIVNKAKVQPKQIEAAKKETGGSAVLKGVCFGEGGTLVFEMARPVAANVVAATKNLLKANAGLTLPVEYRVGRDDETVAESAEPDEAGPGAAGAAAPAAADLGAAWKAKLAAWTPAIKAALAAKGPRTGDIGKLLAQATALSKPGGDIALALQKLTECHQLATAGAAPSSQAKAGADPAAQFKAKLAEWTPAIKAALAAKGPNAAAIGKLLAQANALSKPGGDITQALAKLTECHNLAAAGAAPAGPPKAGTDPAAQFKAKLAAWTPAIKAALAAKGPKAGDIGKLLAQANALSKPGGDSALALAKLTECHALATAGAAPAAQPKPGGDPAAELRAKLAQWAPAIKAAVAAKGPNALDIGKLLAQATALSKPGGDSALALQKLTECHQLATAGAATPAQTPAARWNAVRGAVLAKLQGMMKVVMNSKDPEAVQAELQLKAVMKQLNGKMETQQQATELDRYLQQDDVVAEISERIFDLKTPLLKALGEITPQLLA
jgi:hypothetical protein